MWNTFKVNNKNTRTTIAVHLQPIAKYIETTTFCKSFPLSLFDQCWWVCKLHRGHGADNLKTHNIDMGEWNWILMELSLSFFRENPNKLCFIELSQNFWLAVWLWKKSLKRETWSYVVSPKKNCLFEVLTAQTWNSNLPTNPKQSK